MPSLVLFLMASSMTLSTAVLQAPFSFRLSLTCPTTLCSLLLKSEILIMYLPLTRSASSLLKKLAVPLPVFGVLAKAIHS